MTCGPSLSAGSRPIAEAVLQRVPSDRELSLLASRLGAESEEVLLDLGLSAEAVFRCRSDHQLSHHGAVLAGLVQWRCREGRGATVRRLLQSLEAAQVHGSVLEQVLDSTHQNPPTVTFTPHIANEREGRAGEAGSVAVTTEK